MTDNEIVGEQVKIKAERVANPLMWVGDGEPDAYAAFKMELENAQDKKDLAVVLAIQDVLAIIKDDVRQAKWKAQDFTDGAESALDLVRQAITNRIGGVM